MYLQAIEDAKQFGDEHQIATGILLIALAKFIQDGLRNHIAHPWRTLTDERSNPVMLREAQNALPVDG